jgi:hypothetical protein
MVGMITLFTLHIHKSLEAVKVSFATHLALVGRFPASGETALPSTWEHKLGKNFVKWLELALGTSAHGRVLVRAKRFTLMAARLRTACARLCRFVTVGYKH